MSKIEDRLVVVATFLDPNQARIVRARLEAEGIQVALDGEHHISMDWFISNAIGGVKLLVHDRDLELAREILRSDGPEILDEDTGDDTEPETDAFEMPCPVCNSCDIYREQMKRRLVILSILLLGIPIPFLSRKMVCESCGHRWSKD